jgi:hypothetical protein
LVDGIADIKRVAHINLTFTGVTGGFPHVTIDLEIWKDFIDRAAPCADKYRIALPPGEMNVSSRFAAMRIGGCDLT